MFLKTRRPDYTLKYVKSTVFYLKMLSFNLFFDKVWLGNETFARWTYERGGAGRYIVHQFHHNGSGNGSGDILQSKVPNKGRMRRPTRRFSAITVKHVLADAPL